MGRIEEPLALSQENPTLGTVPNDERLIELGDRCVNVDGPLVFYAAHECVAHAHRIIRGACDCPDLF